MKTFRLTLVFALLFPVMEAAAQVPLYNSYPAASAVLFLDFDGHLLEGTNWNLDGPIFCGPANLKPAQMTEIFNRVAEDYRPFNINVTTDSTVYETAPVEHRMRVVLTITSDWYGVAGGVAYTNSFTWGNNTPCFVFTALHKYNIKNIAEAASHEAGHTLGLRHQAAYDSTCKKLTDYNSGLGSGIAAWAPIMGVGYYRNNTTWHHGPNPYGCSSEQDDLAIITSEQNGFGYRPDDDTATNVAEALPLNTDTALLQATGLITTNTDTDLFKFTMPETGPLSLIVHPYSIAANDEGSNLDVQVQLIDKDQHLLQTYNPADQLSVTVDTTLTRGTYYLAVSGASNLFASNYASLGAYAISGTVPKPVPFATLDFKLQGRVAEKKHQLNWMIATNANIIKQVLERSENGNLFTTVGTLAPRDRMYANTGVKAAQYRLAVTFDNGSMYYSNKITLQSSIAVKTPQLYTTFIHSNSGQVTSPAPYRYTITSITGQVLKTGALQEGVTTIDMGILKSGVYVMVYEKQGERTVQKFILQ
jgi:hypothetical protein